MRYLGVDLGSRRVGIAISDSLARLAHPLRVITRTQSFNLVLDEIAKDIKEFEIDTVVIGIPRTLSGDHGVSAQSIGSDIDRMKQVLSVKIETIDERFTTKIANGYLRDSGKSQRKGRSRIDAMAASIILQSWLDRKNLDNVRAQPPRSEAGSFTSNEVRAQPPRSEAGSATCNGGSVLTSG